MRLLLPIFLLFCFAIVLFQVFAGDKPGDPTNNARKFVKHVQNGEYARAVEAFGGNICRCPAKLGWVSYLIYGSGEEPNLAFLASRAFEFGPITYKKMKGEAKVTTALDQPEDFEVDVPLRFNRRYEPLFLPLDMAYGYEISEEQLNDFLKDPDHEAWKALTLRLRSGLEKGVTDQPEQSKNLVNRAEAEKEKETDEKTKSEATKPDQNQLEKELFYGSDVARYQTPKDAGVVRLADGTLMAPADVAAKLPHLKSALLRLHMVRKDHRQPFTVFHFVVSGPVLSVKDTNGTSTHDLVLKDFRPPVPQP